MDFLNSNTYSSSKTTSRAAASSMPSH
uniref:Uncharacterized protein n=1 Tax=Arundo donax TaxID=35708 RepID=A0A0A9GY80_ARUDO